MDTPKKMAVRLAGHYWVGKAEERKIMSLFSETKRNGKNRCFRLQIANRIEMEKCKNGIDLWLTC